MINSLLFRTKLLVMLLALVSLVFTSCGREKKVVSKKSEKSSDVKAVEGTRETLLSVTANLPRLVNELEKRAPEDAAQDPQAQMVKTVVNQLGIEEVHLLLVVPKGKSLTPVVMVPDSSGKVWNALHEGDWAMFFEKTENDALRPKMETEDADEIPATLKRVVLRSLKGHVVAAEPAILNRIEKGEWSATKELAFQFAQQNKSKGSLVSVGIALPETLPDSLGAMISQDDLAAAGEAGPIGISMLDGIYSQIRDAAKSTEAVAIDFQFKGKDGRQLRVAQQFDSANAAQNAKGLIEQPPEKAASAEGLIAALLATLKSDKLQKKVESGKRSLHLTLSWNAADDRQLGMQLAGAAMGGGGPGPAMGMGVGMGMEPTEGPIAARYESPPNLRADVDKEALEKELAEKLSKRVFPKGAFGTRVSLELDPLVTPNAAFQGFDAKAAVTVTSVKTRDGKEVAADNQAPPIRFHHGSYLTANTIVAKIEDGVETESLKQATLKFEIPVPSVEHAFTFNSNDTGKTFTDGNVSVTLNKLARDVASGVYNEFEGEDQQIHFLATDASGSWLSKSTWTSGGGNWAVRFAGEIEELTIVMTGDKPTVVNPVVTVDLNGGKRLEMPSEPSDDVPSRYEIASHEAYESTDESELDGLQVTFEKDSRRGPPGLNLQLPSTATAAKVRWEVNVFGEKYRAFLQGHAFDGFGQLGHRWRPQEDDALKNADAIFGITRVVVPTEIDTLVFEKESDGEPVSREMDAGTNIEVTFNKQIVTFSLADATVLQMRGMDDTGQALKRERMDQDEQGRYRQFFWGRPTRVELVVAGRIVDRRFPFEFIEGDVDRKKLAAFQSETADLRAVVAQLRRIRELLADRNGQVDGIAGLHFFHDDSGKPANLIPPEVARACPQSAERFGYTAQPFHGYYLYLFEQRLAGDEAKPVGRSASTRTKTWDQGEIEFKPFWGQMPEAFAWPAGGEGPTIMTRWHEVLQKPAEGAKVPKVQPQNTDDWTEINPLDESPLFTQFRNF